jgi:transcriptional regulator with XRE-family HTH domain
VTDDEGPAAAFAADEGPLASDEGIEVEPSVLAWARKSIGLDEKRAERKIGVVVATLQSWESGKKAPSLRQLRKAAAAYKRPLAIPLLPAQPKDFDPLRDFRRSPERASGVPSPELTGEHRRALTQREVVLEISDLGVVPAHVVDKLRALVLGMGLSKLHSDGGLSCSIVRPS